MAETQSAGNNVFKWVVGVVVAVLVVAMLALVFMKKGDSAANNMTKPAAATPDMKKPATETPVAMKPGTPPTPDQIKAQLDALSKQAPPK